MRWKVIKLIQLVKVKFTCKNKIMLDISKVTNSEAKKFITAFFANRAINREYYEIVPEERFDYRMVDNSAQKSDSPRESLGHQIGVQQDYMNGVITGVLKFETGDDKKLKGLSKAELLKKLTEVDEKLVEILSDKNIDNKTVKTSWSKTPISVVSSLWGLDSHEILHTGWNLAVMDHLNIKRFDSLKNIWG